ncbi:MAG TPA: imelysin family protein [Polyangiaceae bacterium]|nr:imelysin family protein [Polyangiaceae bacterium]
MFALVTAGQLAALSCKSFSIDEHVYTGSSGSHSASPVAMGGSSFSAGGSSVRPASSGGAASELSGGQTASNAGEISPEAFSKRAFLRQVADCTVARYQEFEGLAAALAEAAEVNAASPTDSTARTVREAWLAANASWQVAEIFRFGPAARSADQDPGARELRDQIYAWRFGGRCPIETALVEKLYESPAFGSSLINYRGLGALEYLLYYPGTDNQCPDYSGINSKGTWAALGAGEIATRKRTYAAAVARDVLMNSQKLLQAWDAAGDNFRRQLVQPGSGSVYPTEQAALNAVWNGIFYLEKEVKDYKLGIPLGVSECTSGLCPEALEARYAQVSTANIVQNYLGFRKLFQGCGGNYTGLGFEDWLKAIGASDLRARMLSALDGAQQAIDALDPPLEISISQHTDRVWTAYTALKPLTDLLKSEFVTVLDLELPAGAGSDND